MEDLVFTPVNLDAFDQVYRYTSVFGEGSCQHSACSMYSLAEKYGDAVCERDGVLYTLRSRLCDDDFRVYLAPMGHGNMKEAFLNIICDAAAHGKKAKFFSLTEKYANILKEELPDRFDIEEDRDLAEYIYRTEIMAAFSGRKLKKRRSEVNTFWNIYGNRASVTKIEPSDFPDILEFERKWLKKNKETHDMEALGREARMIEVQLSHFEELHLSGIVLRIDGVVSGFGYGTKLSDSYYDAIIEKGDRDVQNVYKVLRQESVKQCAMDCTYVNMEEDVGVPGLRALKYAYKPEFLLHKYIAVER